MSELKQVFTTPDGKIFESKKEALDYLRRPKITLAMNVLTANDKELTNWLVDNQELIEVAFETGTIKRVTKAEHKKLVNALEAIVADGNPKFAFVIANASAIAESFRWPSVKRMTVEEKLVAARNTLLAHTDNNEELTDWVLKNQEQILAAYEAGVEKRQVSPQAAAGLAEYRAKKAAEKAAQAAAG